MKRNSPIYIACLPCMLMAFSLMLLTACTEKEDLLPRPSPEGQPISFSPQAEAGKEQTRALGSDYMKAFTVYGFKKNGSSTDVQVPFPGYDVWWQNGSAGSSSTNHTGWDYTQISHTVGGATQTQDIVYWDFNANYRFFAVAKLLRSDVACTSTVSPDVTISRQTPLQIGQALDQINVQPKKTVKLAFQANASTEATTPFYSHLKLVNPGEWAQPGHEMPAVTLEFLRPFCKVRFMLVDQEERSSESPLSPGSSLAYVSDIAFAPSGDEGYTKLTVGGTVEIVYPLSNPADTVEIVSVKDEGRVAASAPMTVPYGGSTDYFKTKVTGWEDQKWYTFIAEPQGPMTLSLMYGGVKRTSVVAETYVNWQPGYEYTYVFKVTDKVLEFRPELSVYTKWQAGYVGNINW